MERRLGCASCINHVLYKYIYPYVYTRGRERGVEIVGRWTIFKYKIENGENKKE